MVFYILIFSKLPKPVQKYGDEVLLTILFAFALFVVTLCFMSSYLNDIWYTIKTKENQHTKPEIKPQHK